MSTKAERRARVLKARVDQRYRREERRYLLPSDQQVMAEPERRYLVASGEIAARLDKRRGHDAYAVRTVYLAPAGRKAASQTRLRLRFYDGAMVGWLERKRRKGVLVAKRRQPTDGTLPEGYYPLATVTYARKAWEIDGCRITLDAGVTDGTRTLDSHVLEAKGPIPRWLAKMLPKRDKTFSKRRWATGDAAEAEVSVTLRAAEDAVFDAERVRVVAAQRAGAVNAIAGQQPTRGVQ